MKIYNFYSTLFLFFIIGATFITACDTSGVDVDNPEELTKIYMPQASEMPAERTIFLKDKVQEIIYGAAYGGLGSPSNNINIKFKFAPGLADSFNTAQNIDYPLVPEEAFELEATSTIIPAGKLTSAPLKLKVNPFRKMELDQHYILPLSISNLSRGYELNKQLQTTYFLITATLDFFDRSNWAVVDVSSEEAVAEDGKNSGLGIHTIDGNIETYWHTEWYEAQPGYPHHITIDMKEKKTVAGFQVTNRQNDTRGMTRIRFAGSIDGETWTDLGEFAFEQINEPQRFFLQSNTDMQFFKLIALEGPNFFTAVAEISAF